MRVYLSPSVSKFLSTVSLFLALGITFFITTKAISLWSADPNLQEIQKILNHEK